MAVNPDPKPTPDPAAGLAVDRAEIAAAGYVVQAAIALAVSFGAHLSAQNVQAILTFEGALAALGVAYLIHRGSKAA